MNAKKTIVNSISIALISLVLFTQTGVAFAKVFVNNFSLNSALAREESQVASY